MDATTETTHRFPRDVPIDCSAWESFMIVESTYRHWSIRYTERQEPGFDTPPTKRVELPPDNSK